MIKANAKKKRKAKPRPKRRAKRSAASAARKKPVRHRAKKKRKKKAAPKLALFCGRGNLARCRAVLESSLRDALAVPRDQLYHDSGSVGCQDGDQMCFDSISFRPLGAVTQPLIPWVNRPTYQQADEIQGHR